MIQVKAGIRFKRAARVVLSILLVLTLVAIWTGASLAEDATNRAGLIVFYDEETIDYFLVDITDEDMKGMDLLESTGLDLEIQPFGGLGEGVCSIDGHGCPSSNCFCESYSSPVYFWRYFVQEDGQWLPQLRGASQREVRPGEIHLFAWADDNQELPEISFEELAGQVRRPNDESSTASTPIATPGTNDEPTPAPEPDPTPTEPAALHDSGDEADEQRDDSASATECVQFLALLGFVVGIVVWAGVRRYRTGAER